MAIKPIKGILLLVFTIFLSTCSKNTQSKGLLFIGSFTDGKPSTGITVYEFDYSKEEFNQVFVVDSIISPSFIKLSNNNSYLYAATKSQTNANGTITSFKVDGISGQLSLINEVSSGGKEPVHLSISTTEDYIINSNYSGPSVSVHKLNENGSLSEYTQLFTFKDSSVIKNRQDKAYIHSSNFSPNGNFVFVQDLGADKIRAFEFNNTSDKPLKLREDLTEISKPGCGPRHFTFHPNGKYGYGVGELNGKISQYSYSNGELDFINDYLSYSEEQDIYRTADIHISPDGKFLYASNRGPNEDTLAIFAINEVNGNLNFVGHQPTFGEHPRNFTIDPSGKYVLIANQFTNNVVIFKRDLSSGLLTKLPQELNVSKPTSLQMMFSSN